MIWEQNSEDENNAYCYATAFRGNGAYGVYTFFLPARMQDFVYRELTYTLMAKRLTEKAMTDEQKALMLYDWVEFNLTTVNDAKLIDKHPFMDMLRGQAWCDQQGFVLMTFLDKLEMTGRVRDVQGHTTTEVLINGDWCVFDPFSILSHTILIRENLRAMRTSGIWTKKKYTARSLRP